jgi:hypothetical protein
MPERRAGAWRYQAEQVAHCRCCTRAPRAETVAFCAKLSSDAGIRLLVPASF